MEKKVIDSIHQYMFTHRLKHRDVAEAAGITRQALSKIINYNNSPKLSTVCALIDAMQGMAKVRWEWPGTEAK